VRAPTIFVGAILTLAGCSHFREPEPSEPSSLPPVRSLSDTVGLEIVFLKLPVDGDSQIAPMWNEIDETHLPTDLRRSLSANGIRTGRFGSHMPAPLKQMVDELVFPGAEGADPAVKVGAGPIHTCRQLQSRTGQRSELLASEILPEIAVLRSNPEGQIVGNTYHNAQCVWALKTFPQGDGRVRLQLTPEVQYGEPRNRWVGQGTGIFRQVSGRSQKSFDDMQIDTHLTPGQTLVLSGTDQLTGLAQHFFSAGEPARTQGKKLLLIRLARTQYDDLFSAEQILAPIVPATELNSPQ
jgi:hypothetical protein